MTVHEAASVLTCPLKGSIEMKCDQTYMHHKSSHRMLEPSKIELLVLMGDTVSPIAAETIAVWDWASIHMKRKDKFLFQISKMCKEMEFIRKFCSKEAVGGQIHTKLENLYISSAATQQTIQKKSPSKRTSPLHAG